MSQIRNCRLFGRHCTSTPSLFVHSFSLYHISLYKTRKLRYRHVNSLTDSKRAEQGNQSLLGSQFVYMGVFSDDFAAVDIREELCYHSLTEKANSSMPSTRHGAKVQKI